MTDINDDLYVLTGACHCRSVVYRVTSSPRVPLDGVYCHCTDCRLTTGAFCALLATIAPSNLEIDERSLASLSTYHLSPQIALTFCSKCGASITFDSQHKSYVKAQIAVFAPTLDLPNGAHGVRSVVNIKSHIFLDSTIRGGISSIMDDGLPRYAHSSNGELWVDDTIATGNEEMRSDDVLRGGCHCGGIQFTVARPPMGSASDPELAGWIKSGRSFSGVHCFCHTCRLVSGAPFWSWAFIPTKLLTFQSKDTLAIYESSPARGVKRRFCSKCGCHFSYAARDDMWDISAAVLEQPKIEDWIAFRPTPDGKDEADSYLATYIHGWLDTRIPASYMVDGEEYHPEQVRDIQAGREKTGRF